MDTISYKILELAEENDEALKDSILDDLSAHSIFSTFDVREVLRDKIKSNRNDILTIGRNINKLEKTYTCGNDLLIQFSKDDVKAPDDSIIYDIYYRYKFGDGLSRKEIENRIAEMRETNDDVFNYLESHEDELAPLSYALDEMQDAIDNAIADGDPNIIEGNGNILANLIRVQPYARPDELVRLSDDLDYVRCSDNEIYRIFSNCKKVVQGFSYENL